MSEHGILSEWNDDRGFGFITPVTKTAKVFVHISAFKNARRRPQINDKLRFVVARTNEGKVQAKNVEYAR